ncbi:unnamed protein product [Paramecium sonneborni]|uniref:GOLD domain-containing protein n=1 Tax=Paramecium sonneborni TaxID=65129 RepID=A0A8S1QXQ4_9CILI|nr:unnamed protein product [Paramecium sonneborni]
MSESPLITPLLQQYQLELQTKLNECFENNEVKGMLHFIEQLGQDIKDEPQLQDLLNLQLLRKLMKHLSSTNPQQVRSSIIILDAIMQRKIIANRLLHQRGAERTMVDLANSLLNLQQQLRHTSLELHIDELLMGLQVKYIDKKQSDLSLLKVALKSFQDNNSLFIKQLQIVLSSCESIIDQYYLFGGHLQELIYEYLLMIRQMEEKQQANFLTQLLGIYERYILDVQYTIQEMQSRTYYIKIEKQMILHQISNMYKSCAQLLNMILVLPEEIILQKRVYLMIKVLYKYIPDLRIALMGPLQLVMRNLSLFLHKDAQEYKEITIFLYQLIHSSDYDDKFKQSLLEDEDLAYLRENKYFSVKALSYVDESQTVPSLRNLNIQAAFPCYAIVQAASIYCYSFMVDKPNSLIFWSFRTLDYDVSFGLFKLLTIEDLGIIDYLNERNGVKSLIKLQRIESHKQPIIGVTVISNPGLYRIVFDNSYSYLRSKQLFYSIHLLETK